MIPYLCSAICRGPYRATDFTEAFQATRLRVIAQKSTPAVSDAVQHGHAEALGVMEGEFTWKWPPWKIENIYITKEAICWVPAVSFRGVLPFSKSLKEGCAIIENRQHVRCWVLSP